MRMDPRKLRYLVEYVFFSTVVFVLRALPTREAFRLADGLAWLLADVLPGKLTRRHVAEQNLQTAFGDKLTSEQRRDIVRRMWEHLFRMVCEIVQLPRRFRLYNCSDVLSFYQRNECVRAVASGRPVLFLGGHFGNWEISVNTFGHFGFPMGVVARDLDNPWLHRWFQNFRESTGNWMISKRGAGAEMTEELANGGFAALLGDQDAGPKGLFVDFFGTPASTFKSIALLALEFDAIIVVGGAYRLPADQQIGSRWAQFELATEDIIDVRDFQSANRLMELTQRFTTSLESLIRRAPEQYFWVHRRWKSAPRRRTVRSSAA